MDAEVLFGLIYAISVALIQNAVSGTLRFNESSKMLESRSKVMRVAKPTGRHSIFLLRIEGRTPVVVNRSAPLGNIGEKLTNGSQMA